MSVNDESPGTPRRLSIVAGTIRRWASVSLAEPEILGLSGLVRPGDVCFDIGAAYGMYSFPLAELVGPAGRVYSFEPQEVPGRILAAGKRCCGARNLNLTRAAVGSGTGTLDMTLPVHFGLPVRGHAHVPGHEPPGPLTRFSTMRTWSTPVLSVDGFRDQHSVNGVRFMKIDVEGFEPAVLRGARRTIESDHPTLLLEIEDRHLTRHGNTAEAFSRSLRDLGYTMYAWRDRAWVRVGRTMPEKRNYLFTTAGR